MRTSATSDVTLPGEGARFWRPERHSGSPFRKRCVRSIRKTGPPAQLTGPSIRAAKPHRTHAPQALSENIHSQAQPIQF